MTLKTTYSIKGHVLGTLWGGGKASYPTVKLEGPDRAALLLEAENKLVDGSLDSGMGFETLHGAILEVRQLIFVTINEKLFVNKEYSIEFIGILSEGQQEFLQQVIDHNR